MKKYIIVCAAAMSFNALAFDEAHEHQLVSLQNKFCGSFIDHPVTVAKAKALGIPVVQLQSTITEKWYSQQQKSKTDASKTMTASMIAMQRRVVDRTYAGQSIAQVREEMMTDCYNITRQYAETAWANR